MSDQASGSAQPSDLSTNGSAFSVSYVGSAAGSTSAVSGGSGPSTGYSLSGGSGPSTGDGPSGVALACVPTSEGWVCGFVPA